jgi:hypothetical protein
MPSDRRSLEALKNLITETDLLISTPEDRIMRCKELLREALALTDNLLERSNTIPAELSHLKKFASDKPTFI